MCTYMIIHEGGCKEVNVGIPESSNRAQFTPVHPQKPAKRLQTGAKHVTTGCVMTIFLVFRRCFHSAVKHIKRPLESNQRCPKPIDASNAVQTPTSPGAPNRRQQMFSNDMSLRGVKRNGGQVLRKAPESPSHQPLIQDPLSACSSLFWACILHPGSWLGRLVYVPNRIQGARAGSGPRPRASRVFIGRPQFQSELTKACCTPKVALGTNESMGCGRLAALMG